MGGGGVLLAAGAVVIGQVDAGGNRDTVACVGIVVVVKDLKILATGEIAGSHFHGCGSAVIAEREPVIGDRIATAKSIDYAIIIGTA